jgi:threonylcarbamoyladenosine tRNA methylthiotransferase MtaB
MEVVDFKRVKVINIGCKTNYHDSHLIENQFRELGHHVISSFAPLHEEEADLYVINSCTVTHKADRDSMYTVRRIKKMYPNAKIVFTGCKAQLIDTKNEDALAALEDVDFLVGNTKKFKIPEIIESYNEPEVDFNWDDKLVRSKIEEGEGRTRGFLRVQDGCNSRCSFCTISVARGPERSLLISEVMESLFEMSDKGFKEVNLTGIRIGHYGHQMGETLVDLLKAIESAKDLDLRVRVGSLYPDEISDEYIELLTTGKRLCRHIHISQQSLDDGVLKSMKRDYPARLFKEIVDKIRTKSPSTFIGCDLIVGFPGESEEQFESTCNILENLQISDAHIFGYSKRDGTKAAQMENQVPANIIKKRVSTLKKIVDVKRNIFFKEALGSSCSLLVEKNHDKTKTTLKGVTENYLSVEIPYDKLNESKIVPVKITEINDTCLRGELLK